jgi:chromosomal replication initiator protein
MITIAAIEAAVARHYNLREADMVSPERTWRISHPRQVGMYLACKLTRRSMPQIGRAFGGRDHSTVFHAKKAVIARAHDDFKLRNDVRQIAFAVMLEGRA